MFRQEEKEDGEGTSTTLVPVSDWFVSVDVGKRYPVKIVVKVSLVIFVRLYELLNFISITAQI